MVEILEGSLEQRPNRGEVAQHARNQPDVKNTLASASDASGPRQFLDHPKPIHAPSGENLVSPLTPEEGFRSTKQSTNSTTSFSITSDQYMCTQSSANRLAQHEQADIFKPMPKRLLPFNDVCAPAEPYEDEQADEQADEPPHAGGVPNHVLDELRKADHDNGYPPWCILDIDVFEDCDESSSAELQSDPKRRQTQLVELLRKVVCQRSEKVQLCQSTAPQPDDSIAASAIIGPTKAFPGDLSNVSSAQQAAVRTSPM
jgi:hypothetical protein